MFEDSTIVWIPVPRERLLDAYAALATMRPPVLPTPMLSSLKMNFEKHADESAAPIIVSVAMVNRAKREIKHLPQPFTVNDLRIRMGVGRTSANKALLTLIEEGWAKRAGWEGKAKLYEYVPAPEAPTVKQNDPPEVTGRGSITGNGGPVAGTGREALRGNVGHLITQLRKQGWTVKKTSKSHYKAVKDHNIVILSSTPSDMRALQNMVSQLRKAGAKL